MSVLTPFTHALAFVAAGTHEALTSIGADPASGLTWIACIAVLVVVIRSLLVPLTVHGVRQAHAGARARPHLKELAAKYKGKRDAETLREYAEARRAVSAEHGISRLGCLPFLLQIPVWIALVHLLHAAANGVPTGALDHDLVSSLTAATIVGIPLVAHGYLGAGMVHLALIAGLAAAAAGLSYLTQRVFLAENRPVVDLSEPTGQAMAQTMAIMPLLSAGGMLLAGGVAPVALLVYWVANSAWTTSQSFVVWRWFPTPGTPAAARRGIPDPV